MKGLQKQSLQSILSFIKTSCFICTDRLFLLLIYFFILLCIIYGNLKHFSWCYRGSNIMKRLLVSGPDHTALQSALRVTFHASSYVRLSSLRFVLQRGRSILVLLYRFISKTNIGRATHFFKKILSCIRISRLVTLSDFVDKWSYIVVYSLSWIWVNILLELVAKLPGESIERCLNR